MHAIWPHDLFPFFLVGKTEGEPDDDGRILVPSYQGRVRPVRMVSDAVGLGLKSTTERLRQEREKLLREHAAQAANELEEVMRMRLPHEIRRQLVKDDK